MSTNALWILTDVHTTATTLRVLTTAAVMKATCCIPMEGTAMVRKRRKLIQPQWAILQSRFSLPLCLYLSTQTLMNVLWAHTCATRSVTTLLATTHVTVKMDTLLVLLTHTPVMVSKWCVHSRYIYASLQQCPYLS